MLVIGPENDILLSCFLCWLLGLRTMKQTTLSTFSAHIWASMAYSASTFQTKLITLASKKTTFAFISPALIEIYQPSGFSIGSQDAKKHSLFPMLPSSRRPRKIGISGKSAFLLKLWDPSCLVKASYLKPVNTICTFEVFKGLLLVIFIFVGFGRKGQRAEELLHFT